MLSLANTQAAHDAAPDSVQSGSVHMLPRPGLIIGITALHDIAPRWQLGLGLRYTQKGFILRTVYDYHDPDYQYDQALRRRTVMRLNAMELTADGYYQAHGRLRLFSGISLAMAVGQTQRTESQLQVYYNHVEDKSKGYTRHVEYDVSSNVRTLHVGYSMGCSVLVIPKVWLTASGQLTSGLLNHGHHLYNVLAQAAVAYDL